MDFSQLAFESQWQQCFSLIDKWKSAMIEQIVDIHREKSSEIESHKERAAAHARREKTNLILNMDEYFRHTCVLPNEIHTFKTRLTELKQSIIHRPLPLRIEINPSTLKNPIAILPVFDQESFNQRQLLAEYPLKIKSILMTAASDSQIILVSSQFKIFLYDKRIGFVHEINLLDYTDEYPNDLCWSTAHRNFLFLFDHSLWSLDNQQLKQLAQIANKTHSASNLTSSRNFLFLVYDQGEFVERWRVQPQWKLEKRWRKQQPNDLLISLSASPDQLLFYTTRSIQLCTEDLIIRYSIDLTDHAHVYASFTFLPTHRIWLTVDKQTQMLNYFHLNDRTVHTLDQIHARATCPLGDDLALITANKWRLQIVSF